MYKKQGISENHPAYSLHFLHNKKHILVDLLAPDTVCEGFISVYEGYNVGMQLVLSIGFQINCYTWFKISNEIRLFFSACGKQ